MTLPRHSSPENRGSSSGSRLISRLLAVGIYTFFVVQVMLGFCVQKQEESQTEPTPIPCKKCEQSVKEKLNPPEKSPVERIITEQAPSEIASFVCINGQLERLELENKIETLLKPIREDIGGAVDVALILTDNKAIYTKAVVSDQRAKHQPAFTKFQEAVDYLTSRGFNVVTPGPVDHAEDPTVYRQYLQRLAQLGGDQKLKDPEFFAYDKRRAQNHVRQAISGELCYRHMAATGKDYSRGIVSRWRDDVGFLKPLKISKFHKWLHDPPAVDEENDLAIVKPGQWRPTLVTPFCRNWQGMNDRGAFVHPKGAYSYFMTPIAAFTRAQTLPKDRVCNHERFLRHIYNLEGFVFIPTRDLYPIPMYINEGIGVFRKEEKDKQLCRIWWKSYRPDCPRRDEPPIEILDSASISQRVEDSSAKKAPVTNTPPAGAAGKSYLEKLEALAAPDIFSFVCINGQLERLELENKIETLLDPIREDIGGDVDIALVLTENSALYTKAAVSEQRKHHQPAFSQYQDAVDYLTKRGFTVVTTEAASHSKDPLVYPEYQQRLAQLANDKKIKTPELFAYNYKRAQNHVRQSISGELCYRHMINTGRDYSRGIVSRWRDDVGFEERLPMKEFFDSIHDPPPVKAEDDFGRKKEFRPTMVTPFCRNWNGLNDRGAFVHPKGAYSYFMAPIAGFTSARPLPPKRICNYERFLRLLYNDEGFIYVPTRKLYPVPMFNNNGTGVFREEELARLCRSFWNSWNMDCPRNNETITILTS